MNVSQWDNLVPLTPQTAGILLALSRGPLYGYAIKQQVQHDLHLEISIGSLYPSLSRLEYMGFIAPAGHAKSIASPHQRKLYEITSDGRYILQLETNRQANFVGLARAYNQQ